MKNDSQSQEKNSQITDNQKVIVENGNIFINQSQEVIFDKILSSVEKISFRILAGEKFSEDDAKKLEQKHYVVIVTEYVLKKAKTLGYRLAKNNGTTYIFNGNYWVQVPESLLEALLGECALKMSLDPIESKFFRFRENLLKQFFSCADLSNPKNSKDKVLINLQNGTFEITSQKQEIRPFDDADFLRYQLPFSFTPNAKAPLFQSYLDKVLPEKELQDILAEYIGYVFVKNLKLEKVLLLYGSGANGKSVFFEVICEMLGRQNVSNFSFNSLSNETYRSNIEDKLLNYGSELKGTMDSDIFKQLASGEPVGAKRLYKDPYVMYDYAKLMFNANELPKDVEHNEAYFRRFLLIPFLVTIPKEERDPNLPTKIIKNELSGVFNWVLSGLNRLLDKKGFTSSVTSDNFLEKYKNESDTVFMFLLEQNYKPCLDGKYTKLSEIYPEYVTTCKASGYLPLNIRNFVNRLEVNRLKTKRLNFGNVVYAKKEVIIF